MKWLSAHRAANTFPVTNQGQQPFAIFCWTPKDNRPERPMDVRGGNRCDGKLRVRQLHALSPPRTFGVRRHETASRDCGGRELPIAAARNGAARASSKRCAITAGRLVAIVPVAEIVLARRRVASAAQRNPAYVRQSVPINVVVRGAGVQSVPSYVLLSFWSLKRILVSLFFSLTF